MLFVFVGLCFWGVNHKQQTLLDERRKLGPADLPLTDQMTPMVAFTTVALGGFRGIIADVMWVRAARLQEEGKYFELVQLADWITKLEPRFPEVWAFQAWNMTYNISVLFTTPEDRWRWVNHGIELLRDEGIPNNPASAKLYWELGWFYQHKIGQNLDQMHRYYKMQLAEEMGICLGGPSADYRMFKNVPRTEKEFLSDPNLKAFVSQLRELTLNPFTMEIFFDQEIMVKLKELNMEDTTLTQWLNFVRKQHIQKKLKLDLATMEELDGIYGPFDWRLPNAHAVYWAFKGLPYAKGYQQIELHRMIFQNMAEAFRGGRIRINEGIVSLSPNLQMMDNAEKAYEAAIEKFNDNTFDTGYKNFLGDAAVNLYAFGRIEEAKEKFEKLHELYPNELTKNGFERFIIQLSSEDDVSTMSQAEANGFVESNLYQGLYYYALGDNTRGAGYFRKARLIWKAYMEYRGNSVDFTERTGLAPIHIATKNAMERLRENLQRDQQIKDKERILKQAEGALSTELNPLIVK